MKTKEELNALKEEVEPLNKKLADLTEEELSTVVGGFANEHDIYMAFDNAAYRFECLSRDKAYNMESDTIVSEMLSICLHMSEGTSPSEHMVNDTVKRLEELCSSLVNTNTLHIPDIARDILNELKGSLGL